MSIVRQAGGPAEAAVHIDVRIDGRALRVPPGTLVAAALELDRPGIGTRRAAHGQHRQAFCGMGVCGECRVAIDGQAHRLGCQVTCTPGMEIHRDE